MSVWQDTIALILVALAVASLARRGWRLFFQRPRGCGACGTCSGSSKELAVMTIAPLLSKDGQSVP